MLPSAPIVAYPALPFAVFCMGEPLQLDYLWAGLCPMGAVYFIFR